MTVGHGYLHPRIKIALEGRRETVLARIGERHVESSRAAVRALLDDPESYLALSRFWSFLSNGVTAPCFFDGLYPYLRSFRRRHFEGL